MRQLTYQLRLLGGLAMMIPLFAMLAVTPSVAAQQGNSTVEFHKRTCPTGYAGNNFFQDCHDNPTEGVTFELGTHRATTGADGNVVFTDFPNGTFTVTESVPGHAADTVVFCSHGDDIEQSASFVYRDAGGILLDVPENAYIICDWYNVPYDLRGPPQDGEPTGATLELHARLCPAGYQGNTPFEDCHDNPMREVTYALNGLSTTTGQDGNAFFYELEPDAYTVRQAGQGGFWFFTVYCSFREDASEQVPTEYVSNGFEIAIDDVDIICDWYNIPHADDGPPVDAGDPGRLTLHKLECPAGYDGDAYFQDCHDNRLEGVEYTAVGPAGFVREDVASDAEGVVVFDGIEVGGTVGVLEQFETAPPLAYFVVYCSDAAGNPVQFDYVERSDEGGIRLSVFPGERVLCDWYNIPID